MGSWPERLENCYAKKIPISIQKKADLLIYRGFLFGGFYG
jgi:hypothetical protein